MACIYNHIHEYVFNNIIFLRVHFQTFAHRFYDIEPLCVDPTNNDTPLSKVVDNTVHGTGLKDASRESPERLYLSPGSRKFQKQLVELRYINERGIYISYNN